jgi:hypothetical protein
LLNSAAGQALMPNPNGTKFFCAFRFDSSCISGIVSIFAMVIGMGSNNWVLTCH